MKRIVIYLKDGREIVCCPLSDSHALTTTREGFRCKVMTTDGDKGHSHVYYDGQCFNSGRERGRATIFYQKGTWWQSHVHLKGWSFSFIPPRKKILEQELTVLASRILDINQELNTLR